MRRSVFPMLSFVLLAVFIPKLVCAIVTKNLNSTTAEELAQSLVGAGITISNVTVTGADVAIGSFTGGLAEGLGIDSGVVLSTGNIADVGGPNEDDGKSTNNGTEGDSDLESLVGATTYDAAILEFDFVPNSRYFSFLYVFASEEYNEYVGSEFNDVFAFFLNGKNIALIPLSEEAVSINNLNSGKNSEFFNNNDSGDLGSPTPFNTQFDGFTNIMWAQGIVTPGETYHIKLAIADVGDGILDSAVFIQSGSFSSTIPIIAASHDAYDFGGVALGNMKTGSFAVGNPGIGNLTIGSIKITGPHADEFSIQNSTCPQGVLGPSQTCTLDVAFTPKTPGDKSATIQIISNAFETPVLNIALTGSGEIYIALRTHNGAYVSAVNGGGDNVTADSYTYGPWERFSVKILNNGRYALKTYNGHYVNALNGGGGDVVAIPMTNWGIRSSTRGLRLVEVCGGRLCWENFSIVVLENYNVAFKSFYGYYLSAVGGGGGDFVAYSTSIGNSETFAVEFVNE